jgi:trigger factor
LNHITEDLVERHEINLPDSFFKRWIHANNENEEISTQQLDEQYPHYANSARWQLLQDKIIKEHNLAVGYGDVVNFTMGLLASNYQSYNMPIPEPAELQKLAEDYFKNKEEEGRQISNMLFEQRLVELVRNVAKVSEKNVSLEEFQAIASGEKKK